MFGCPVGAGKQEEPRASSSVITQNKAALEEDTSEKP